MKKGFLKILVIIVLLLVPVSYILDIFIILPLKYIFKRESFGDVGIRTFTDVLKYHHLATIVFIEEMIEYLRK